ncbi:alkyl hydroperoxide reductase/ Thiol specific antioxidant/ Mal allergen [Candidatus Koribacter versatilis Ellin345]|uniref:Thioredoxin peroxidase n=3 Tax=Candidatus Korobacter versatilis TaxID=658062 RepID=Q1IH70_KORVE|nr:alkyl hydroperoxide reductase/ Thiol specific antioxidant/ Mal allergen [Candidatus Koribacter versatilis Ellin345]
MPAYQVELDKFAGYDAQVVGISIDTIYSHMAWQQKETGWMDYPLASDFYPHGAVAQLYGVFREKPPIPGINERAIFVIDKEGIIRFSKVYDLGQQPPNEEVFEVLEKLKNAPQS